MQDLAKSTVTKFFDPEYFVFLCLFSFKKKSGLYLSTTPYQTLFLSHKTKKKKLLEWGDSYTREYELQGVGYGVCDTTCCGGEEKPIQTNEKKHIEANY